MFLGIVLSMALGFMAAAAGTAHAFTEVYVFGDSLSDSGNVGRFSNGPVWVERLAERLGAAAEPSERGGTNYAIGGALAAGRSESALAAQVERFIRSRDGGRADPDALYIVWAGGNDLLAQMRGVAPGAAEAAADAVGGVVERLAAAGARHFLVPNLPDIGRTPEARSRGEAAMRAGREIARVYNAAVDRVLASAAAAHPITIHRLDTFRLLERVATDPSAAEFENVTEACANRVGVGCADPDRFVFWDGIHPTTAAHARLAQEAVRVLAAATQTNR